YHSPLSHSRAIQPFPTRRSSDLYAKRRFIVSDDSVPGGPTTCPCGGTLSIHGSLTAGSLSPTEPRYATRYEFDERFERVRPPGRSEEHTSELQSRGHLVCRLLLE